MKQRTRILLTMFVISMAIMSSFQNCSPKKPAAKTPIVNSTTPAVTEEEVYQQPSTPDVMACPEGSTKDLSGECISESAQNCLYNGFTIENGKSMTGFLASEPDANGDCHSEERICENGVLSGSFEQVSCSPVKLDGVCGASNGALSLDAPSADLCLAGESSALSGEGPWLWSCSGKNGGVTVECGAYRQVLEKSDGACGSSHLSQFTAEPKENLCLQGAPASMAGNGPWLWVCLGSNGGNNADCSASVAPSPIDGQCGASNGTILSSEPNQLCNFGYASSLSTDINGNWSWSCSGQNGGLQALCSANHQAAINGACGASDNQTLYTAPTDLCSSGEASSISGNGPWSWICLGSQGGNNVNCSANVVKPVIKSITPDIGKFKGSSTVTITGSEFYAGATVTIGSFKCVVSSINSTTIICTITSPSQQGTFDVVVKNSNGESATLPAAFTVNAQGKK